MKHLKYFEILDGSQEPSQEPIGLIGYPEGNIVEVSTEEFYELIGLENNNDRNFEIEWDDEVDYDEGSPGQWRFFNTEEDKLMDWLEQRRDPMSYTAKKYNI